MLVLTVATCVFGLFLLLHVVHSAKVAQVEVPAGFPEKAVLAGSSLPGLYAALSKGDTDAEITLLSQQCRAEIGVDHAALASALLTTYDVDAEVTTGVPALVVAVALNEKTLVEYLLANNVKVGVADCSGRTALWWAARCSHTDVAKLIVAKSDVNRKDSEGNTALDMAVKVGNAVITETLLDHGVNDLTHNRVDDLGSDGLSPLVTAVKAGYLDVASKLLANKASVNKQVKGYSPLHWAAQGGSNNLAALLLQHGASANEIGADGHSPLTVAVLSCNVDLAKQLVSQGGDVNYSIDQGVTSLMIAASLGCDELVRVALSKGAFVNAVDLKGLTALHYAAKACRKDTMQLLLGLGANKEIQSKAGSTAFQVLQASSCA